MRTACCILILAACMTYGCGYNDFGEPATPDYETVLPNMDIGYLRAQYKGEPLNINDEVVVAGFVTANDKGNNFYRTFTIQDNTGALEVKAGMYDLHNIFPYGRRIAIKAEGLVLDMYNGVLQVGTKSLEGSSRTGYISTRYYPGGYFWPQTEYGSVVPLALGLGDIADDKCGFLVRVEGLRFVPGELEGEYITWAQKGGNGYRVFRDGGEREITVVTSSYADFAGMRVPAGQVSLTGILMKGNTDTARNVYMIKLRNIGDVAEE